METLCFEIIDHSVLLLSSPFPSVAPAAASRL